MGDKKKGLLIVLSAPSGAGKSTLCQHLLKKNRNMMYSISVTTRLPRPGEVDGQDYFFVTDAAFKAMIRRGEFAEHALVHGHSYGTPKSFLNRVRNDGRDVLLDIDVQGALQVKRHYPDAVLIFITTPTLEELERRLRARCSETEAQLRLRLAAARREMGFLKRYDYHVVNDRIASAFEKLMAIVQAEKLRIRHL